MAARSRERRAVPGRRFGLQGKVAEVFARFMRVEASGAIVMLGAAAVALVLANSAASAAFSGLWQIELGMVAGGWSLVEPALLWVNDALMGLFFFVVGLEIKRELIVGELSDRRKAALPILAAVGGMLLPAAIYAVVTAQSSEAVRGWGIPMATDIAFALGVLALVGSRAPASLRVFLAALAIADDIGAVLVIALFYTGSIELGWIALAIALFAVMVALNRLGFDSPWPYLLIGSVMWFATLNSGVHATVAAVAAAFAIPAGARLSPVDFASFARDRLDELESAHTPGTHALQAQVEAACASDVCEAARLTAAPLQRLELAIAPISTYFVLPLFALANAGVRFAEVDLGADPAKLGVVGGIALGLGVGKPVGIALLTWLAVRLGWSDLPSGCNWRHIAGAAALGGVGFTMSMFIANLAFGADGMLSAAKVAVLATSLVMGVVGFAILRSATIPARDL